MAHRMHRKTQNQAQKMARDHGRVTSPHPPLLLNLDKAWLLGDTGQRTCLSSQQSRL